MEINRHEQEQHEAEEAVDKFQKAWDEVRKGLWHNIILELNLKIEEQETQWGSPVFAHDMKTWAAIIGMEYGKLCKSTLRFGEDGDRDKFKKQLIDIAGVAMSALHGLDMEEIDEASRDDGN